MIGAVVVAAVAAQMELVCVSDRTKQNTTLGAGLSYACSLGGVDCATINPGGAQFYPNNIYAHCDWAFEQYYKAHTVGGAQSCDFGGAAFLVNCSTACTKCQAKPDASDAAVKTALGYLCGPQGVLGDRCAAIAPNGTHYEPNTPVAHFDYVADIYYQTYRCAQPVSVSCDFGGTAEVVGC